MSTSGPTTDQTRAVDQQGGGLTTTLVVVAAVAVLAEAWQFVTAGQLLPGDGALPAHQAGAIGLHVASGLTLGAAFFAHRSGAAPARLWLLAGVVFVLTFVQAATGGRDTLWIHVPGAMVVTVGSVWVLVVAVGLRGRRRQGTTSQA